MLRLWVTNVGGFRIAHRPAIEYPGFVMPTFLEPGERCTVTGEPMVVKHQHTDGHRYNIFFYRLQAGNKYIYVCDFNPDYPSQRSLVCDGRYSDHPTTIIINVGHSPYAFRAGPTYPGTKLSGFLEKGESATVFSEFRLIPYIHKDEHVYYIHSYRLVDNSGWVPDFDPDHPDKRTMHDKCGFPLEEMRNMAKACGLREVYHDPKEFIAAFATSDHAKVIVYYATGTVVTSMHHPRQGTTQLFRRNQTMEGLRDIFLNPGVYPDIGYTDRGKKRGPNSPPVKQNANVSPPPAVKGSAEEIVNEEEAILRQLKKLDAEAMYIDLERQRLSIALESYEKHRVAERRREAERSNRLAQQQAALTAVERNLQRGTEMVCHTSNNHFVRKHWEPSVSSVALGTKCEFLMFDDGAMACSNPDGLPSKMLASISDRGRHAINPPRYCALGSASRYFVAYGNEGVEREWAAPEPFAHALASLAAREAAPRGAPPGTPGKSVVKSVTFGEGMDSWAIVLTDGTCMFSGLPTRLHALVTAIPVGSAASLPQPAPGAAYQVSGGDIEELSLGPSGEWFILRRGAKMGEWESRSSKFLNAAKAIKTKITAMYFGSDFTYLIRHK